MTEESQWLLDRCDELVTNSEKYEERAFFQQLKIFLFNKQMNEKQP